MNQNCTVNLRKRVKKVRKPILHFRGLLADALKRIFQTSKKKYRMEKEEKLLGTKIFPTLSSLTQKSKK